jgi:phosphoglycerate dehydrogenase-like enzyme
MNQLTYREPANNNPYVVLRADLLTEAHVSRLRGICHGWADFIRVSESANIRDVEPEIFKATILLGWAPVPTLLASSIQYYLCGSAGFDAYQGVGLESKSGFVFTNAAGTMSIPLAEHALAFMFMATRRLYHHVEQQRDRKWSRIPDAGELFGSTVCIVGFGGIGTELSRRCSALGMRVTAVKRTPGAIEGVDQVFTPGELAKAVDGADHVVSCLPGGAETRGVFNREIFSAMKPGAAFHAVSRGSVIDFPALEEALQSGRLAFAGLDVCDREPLAQESPLWEMPNVLLTSHSAGWSPQLAGRLCDLFAENLQDIRHDRPLKNIISLR